MQKVAAVLLIMCYLALGSGAMEYWHNAQHQAEDARLAAAARRDGSPVLPAPLHNEFNCAIHAQLYLAGLGVAWVPLLICLGLFVAFLSLLPGKLAPQRVVFAIPCRGPPAR